MSSATLNRLSSGISVMKGNPMGCSRSAMLRNTRSRCRRGGIRRMMSSASEPCGSITHRPSPRARSGAAMLDKSTDLPVPVPPSMKTCWP